MTIWHKMQTIDRRVLFLLVIVGVCGALIRPMGLPLSISPYTQQAYDAIDKLPKDSVVIISPSFDPGTEAEMLPQCTAQTVHVLRRGLKVVWVCLSTSSPMYARRLMNDFGPGFKYEYGKDYIILPYKANEEATISAMGADIRALYKQDVDGKSLDTLPLWSQIKTVKDVKLVIDYVPGTTMLTYMRLLNAPYGVPISGGGTGVMTPLLAPYIQGGQLQGVLSGLRGAAEYEKLIDRPGTGLAGMDAQSLTHMTIIIFIVLGNIGAIMIGRSGKGGSAR